MAGRVLVVDDEKMIVKAVRPRTKLTHGGFQTQVQGTLLTDCISQVHSAYTRDLSPDCASWYG